MAGLTLANAEAQLAVWLAASTAVAGNQSYEIAGRSLTRADAGEIRKNVEFWDTQCKNLAASGGGVRIFAGVPQD